MTFTLAFPGVFRAPAPTPTFTPFPRPPVPETFKDKIRETLAERGAKENASASNGPTLSQTVQALDATKNAWSAFGG